MARELDLNKAVRVLARAVVAIADRDMFTLGDDVYLLAEEPLRVGERVVVADEPGGGSCPEDRTHAGKHGTVADMGLTIARVQLDNGPRWICWLKDLRREREDERPAEKKQEPPFALGRWVQDSCKPPCKGVVVSGRTPTGCYQVKYLTGEHAECTGYRHEGNLTPCAPVVTDAMKLLCWPGTRVRMVDSPSTCPGIPYSRVTHSGEFSCRGQLGTVTDIDGTELKKARESLYIRSSADEPAPVRAGVHFDGGKTLWCWPWNLDPAGSEK